MESQPLVSVCIQTYQHAAFIGQCLDSVLAQQTDFSYEIILGEDDSTDGTREICIHYQQRYPDHIRLFLRSAEDKVFIKGKKTGRFNFIENLKAARGKYIALLDGDDYWCDKDKLAFQAAFLEAHESYSLCFGKTYELKENRLTLDTDPFRGPVQREYNGIDLTAYCFIPSGSCMFRKPDPFDLPAYFWQTPYLDYPLFLHLATKGSIHYSPQPVSVYRKHEGGIWSLHHPLEHSYSTLDLLNIIIPEFQTGMQEGLRQQRMTILKRIIKHRLLQNNHPALARFLGNYASGLSAKETATLRSYYDKNKLRYQLKGKWQRLIKPIPPKETN